VNKLITPKIGPQMMGDAYTVSDLLAALSTEQFNKLIGFARLRLRAVTRSLELRGCLASTDPEDLVAEAFLKLKLGEDNPSLGRHLKARNRTSTEAFLESVRGIINSDLDHLVQEAKARYLHLPVGDVDNEPGAVDPAAPEDTYQLLSRRDLQQVLFAKLYQSIRNQPALLGIVRDWEVRFLDDDHIGAEGQNASMVHRVRQFAREILAELAVELSPTPGDGKEMVL